MFWPKKKGSIKISLYIFKQALWIGIWIFSENDPSLQIKQRPNHNNHVDSIVTVHILISRDNNLSETTLMSQKKK